MPETRKVLGQKSPAPSTLETLYTVGASTQAVVSTITVCNTGATDGSFRISIAVGGTADSIEQYIYYNLPLPGLDVFAMTEGFTMNDGDEIRCYSDIAGITFNAFGVEITP